MKDDFNIPDFCKLMRGEKNNERKCKTNCNEIHGPLLAGDN